MMEGLRLQVRDNAVKLQKHLNLKMFWIAREGRRAPASKQAPSKPGTPPEEQLTSGIGRKEPQYPGHACRLYGVLTDGLVCQGIKVRPGTLRLPYGSQELS
jgi:hypothetical protein